MEGELKCPKCNNDERITKAGHYYFGLDRKRRIQKWYCEKCGKTFTESSRKHGTRYSDEIVEFAIALLRNRKKREEVREEIYSKFKVKITRETLTGWRQKFLPRSYEESRDMEVRKKVVDAIFSMVSYEELARLSSVRQETLRHMFYVFVNKKLPPEVMDKRVLALRIGALGKKVENNSQEIRGIVKQFEEMENDEVSKSF